MRRPQDAPGLSHARILWTRSPDSFIVVMHPLPWSAKRVAAREYPLYRSGVGGQIPHSMNYTAVLVGRIRARRYVRLNGVRRFDELSVCFRLFVLPPSPDAAKSAGDRFVKRYHINRSSRSDTAPITDSTALM